MMMSNFKLLKRDVSNLKENIEVVESDDVEMNKLHDRIYSLKMSILAIDEQLQNECKPTFSCLRESTFQKLVQLANLKETYKIELENLELLL